MVTRARLAALAISALPHAIGWLAIALVVAGIWGRWGWEFAAMLGGAIPAGFYIWGQARAARPQRPGGPD